MTHKTTIAAIKATRDMTGFTLVETKKTVDALVILANNGTLPPADVNLSTPKGPVKLVDLFVILNKLAR